MKRSLVIILILVSFISRSQIVPKDTLLIVGDSILIGNCFVKIKNASSVYCVCDSLVSGEAFVANYFESSDISLTALKENFQLLITDTTFKIFDGNIALVKLNRSRESVIYSTIFFNFDSVPQAEILESGDMIVFLCVRAYKNRKLYNFATRWYYIR
jgi:hypothetical protein